MIVIDASALAKYLLREPGYTAVEQYLIKGAYSVDHVLKEVSNAIWKHAIVYKRIPPHLARELYRALLMLLEGELLIVEPQEKYMHQAFEIALDYGIPVYDALYVSQAKARNWKLLTSDKVQASVTEKLEVETIYI